MKTTDKLMRYMRILHKDFIPRCYGAKDFDVTDSRVIVNFPVSNWIGEPAGNNLPDLRGRDAVSQMIYRHLSTKVNTYPPIPQSFPFFCV